MTTTDKNNEGTVNVEKKVEKATKKTNKVLKAKGNKVGKKTETITKRHRQKRDNLESISNPGLRRLARRGGVVRASKDVFNETREILREFVDTVVKDSVMLCESSKRKTVVVNDVMYSLKRNDAALFGYN